MANKKDIEFSQRQDDLDNGRAKKEELAASLAVTRNPSDEKTYVIFKLVDTKKRGRVHVHNVDDVLDPATGEVRRMRVLVGVKSLWMDEQKNVTEEYARQNRPFMVFEDRHMRIPEFNKNVIDFLRRTNDCVDVPKRAKGGKNPYFEWNPAKQEEESLKKEKFEIEMTLLAAEQPVEKMKKHAQFLGVLFTDELGERKTDDGIRTEYIIKAKRNPSLFKETLGSKAVEISWMIKRAILDSKIELGRQVGEAHFASGGFICKIPASRKPFEYLVELAMTNSEEGKGFLEKLQEHTT